MPRNINTTKLAKQPPSERHEQASVEALFSSFGEGIIATDSRAIITRVNQVALDILGYHHRELLGKWFPEVIIALKDDGSIIDMIDRPIERVLLTGRTVEERLNYMTNNGDIVPVALTISPIIVRNRPVGVIQAFRDISVEVQNEKLKTEFISIASHQLRTPLTAVNMYAQMLNDGLAGKLSGSQQSFLEVIIAAVARMNELINTLLNITRIEAGSITVDPQLTDLTKLVDALITELTPTAKQKHIRLTFEADSAVPQIETDALLVKEVFSNLLSNAIKFTPIRGKVTATLYLERRNIVFRVTDTGYGIPKSAHAHIFTKFFRADNIVAQDVSGTGLGLYLTKTIAENLGGDMWFTSKVDKGSTFYFALPLGGSTRKQGKFRLDT